MSVPLQITPAFPPDISGVGDYAAVLSAKFDEAGEPMATLVARPGARDAHRTDDVTYLPQPKAEALAQAIDGYDRVLLHFSGYGYARRGLCRWLVDGLSRWKARSHRRRLVTMFHEVYATGPIWRSSFWTLAAQRRIARDLAMLSDAGFVSSEGGQHQLARLAPDLPLELLPVFSNMGEPEQPRPLSDRSGQAVVFGGQARRDRVYKELGQADVAVADCLGQAGVTEIIDIGPEMDVPKQVAGCPVKVLGPRPTKEVSAELSDARIGLIDYPGHVFTKSGIAAAYFSHRLVVVNTSPIGGFPTDLKDGEQFLRLESFARGGCEPQAIADAGHRWYQQHGVSAAVEKFRAGLE